MRTVGFALVVAAGIVTLAAAGRTGAPAQGGTVTGKVKFTGAKPAMAKIDMSDEAVCAKKYTTPPTDESVIVGPTGGLANVFVYVKAGLPAGATYPVPATPVEIDQDGCRYHPHVLGIMVGQTLAIKNADGILHNIKAKAVKNRPFNVSQPTSMTTPRTFSAPEVMIPLECNVHGWMNAFVGVLDHPYFAVTGADGKFSLKGLPPGTYTIEAWHEKYGAQTATVTVTAGPKTADFTFTGK